MKHALEHLGEQGPQHHRQHRRIDDDGDDLLFGQFALQLRIALILLHGIGAAKDDIQRESAGEERQNRQQQRVSYQRHRRHDDLPGDGDRQLCMLALIPFEVDGIEQLQHRQRQQDTRQKMDIRARLRPNATEAILHTGDYPLADQKENRYRAHQDRQEKIIGASNNFFHGSFLLPTARRSVLCFIYAGDCL